MQITEKDYTTQYLLHFSTTKYFDIDTVHSSAKWMRQVDFTLLLSNSLYLCLTQYVPRKPSNPLSKDFEVDSQNGKKILSEFEL